jgi:hypothetical protein
VVRLGRALLAAVLLAPTACGPSPTLDEALSGRPCRSSAPYCLDGFACNASNVCVPSNQLGSAGTSGDDVRGDAGSSSEPSGAGGSGSDAVAVGQGGTGSGIVVGADGNDDADAGSPPAAADAATPSEATDGCVPTPLFQDLDGDGYGNVAVQVFGCARDGFVSTPGDCLDADPAELEVAATVHPGQLEYFFVGYRDTSKPGDISFDYDCSGSEDADPQFPSGTPVCEALMGLNDCDGAGYLPDIARQGVSGVDALCGSEVVVSCGPGGPGQCNSFYTATDQLFLCR